MRYFYVNTMSNLRNSHLILGCEQPTLGAGHPTLSDRQDEQFDDSDVGLAPSPVKPQLKRPSMYRVVLLNDDYTPMDFVVHVLEVFFGMNREKATQVMLAVHVQGKGVCGIYTRDIAETKSAQVNQYSSDNEHPLLSDIEPVDDADA